MASHFPQLIENDFTFSKLRNQKSLHFLTLNFYYTIVLGKNPEFWFHMHSNRAGLASHSKLPVPNNLQEFSSETPQLRHRKHAHSLTFLGFTEGGGAIPTTESELNAVKPMCIITTTMEARFLASFEFICHIFSTYVCVWVYVMLTVAFHYPAQTSFSSHRSDGKENDNG